MKKYEVTYSLSYNHIVTVGVLASSGDKAVEKAQKAFNLGTLWNDTPTMPHLFNDYEEVEDNTLTFEAKEVSEFKRDHSVAVYKKQAAADALLETCKAVLALLEQGQANTMTLEHDGIYIRDAIAKAQ
jgi:hypothetical protein